MVEPRLRLEHALQNCLTNKPQQTHDSYDSYDSYGPWFFSFSMFQLSSEAVWTPDCWRISLCSQTTGARSQPDLSMETAGITSTVLDVGAGRMESRSSSRDSSRIQAEATCKLYKLPFGKLTWILDHWNILLEYHEYHWLLDNWHITRLYNRLVN